MSSNADSRPLVSVVEVGPRDGLQNERIRLSTAQKVSLIDDLVAAGLTDVEVGSFVHPKWIPQMADTGDVVRGLLARDGVSYWVLVPNVRGLDGALRAGAEHVAVFLSSSETHNRKNLNRTIDESLENVADVVGGALERDVDVRGYISTVFGCPYEGDVDFGRVLRVTERLLDLGCAQVSLGDTTGMGTPGQVRAGTEAALAHFDVDQLALHLHDTRGLAIANALVAAEAGFRTFDASVGGMGGCPYAPGAAGNIGTEDLVNMLHASGFRTTVDLDRLLRVSHRLEVDHGATLNSAYYRYSRTAHRPNR